MTGREGIPALPPLLLPPLASQSAEAGAEDSGKAGGGRGANTPLEMEPRGVYGPAMDVQ